jgi:hypothetical protein
MVGLEIGPVGNQRNPLIPNCPGRGIVKDIEFTVTTKMI